MRLGISVAIALVLSGVAHATAFGQAASRTAEANEANNPLTPKITLNLRDQAARNLYEIDGSSNALLLRGVVPNKLLEMPQLLRFTMPITTAPVESGHTIGLGDLKLMDRFPFKRGGAEFGVGPQLTIPTASPRPRSSSGSTSSFLSWVVDPERTAMR